MNRLSCYIEIIFVNIKLHALISFSLLPLLLVSCSNGKHAYEGSKRNISELATIEVVPTNTTKSILVQNTEKPLITHVDDMKVGSYTSSYPKKIFVLPGHRVIKTEYYNSKSMKSSATNIGIFAGGVIGAAIGSSIDRARNSEFIAKTKRETKIQVKAGATYQLRAQSADGKGNGLKVWIEPSPTP